MQGYDEFSASIVKNALKNHHLVRGMKFPTQEKNLISAGIVTYALTTHQRV